MEEYGIFNDEGLLEGDFWYRESADEALACDYSEDDEAYVDFVCPQCREAASGDCDCEDE